MELIQIQEIFFYFKQNIICLYKFFTSPVNKCIEVVIDICPITFLIFGCEFIIRRRRRSSIVITFRKKNIPSFESHSEIRIFIQLHYIMFTNLPQTHPEQEIRMMIKTLINLVQNMSMKTSEFTSIFWTKCISVFIIIRISCTGCVCRRFLNII